MNPDDLLRVQTQAEALLDDDTLATRFYERLFAAHPDTAELFAADLTAQRARFGNELAVLIAALRDLPRFENRARVLGRRHHDDHGVRLEHYRFVGDALIAAVEDRLGAAFTDEDRTAWMRAYNLVSELMQEGARTTEPSD
jgi:nitric oxide dioxygenase